jgi:hypothetical protein
MIPMEDLHTTVVVVARVRDMAAGSAIHKDILKPLKEDGKTVRMDQAAAVAIRTTMITVMTTVEAAAVHAEATILRMTTKAVVDVARDKAMAAGSAIHRDILKLLKGAGKTARADQAAAVVIPTTKKMMTGTMTAGAAATATTPVKKMDMAVAGRTGADATKRSNNKLTKKGRANKCMALFILS